MVESNVSPSLTDSISPESAAQNVAVLRTQAESWLAVLFNVFGSVGRDGRGMVGDVISAWAAIAGEQVFSLVLIILSYC
jgi:ribosomal RNA-processing protein 12